MKNKITKKIGVIGLGLIGGSLAKALKKNNIPVVGYDVDHKTRKQAIAEKIPVETELNQLVQKSDIVVLATPLDKTPEIAIKVIECCQKGILITDVGSVKVPFHELANKFSNMSHVRWIGGHPMAGTEHSGFLYSKEGLFQGAVWALSMDERTKIEDYLLLSQIILTIGAKIIPISPSVHDDSVARISHFPYIVSSLVAKLAGESSFPKLTLNLAAGSFRDVTRVSGSSTDFSTNLVMSNTQNVVSMVESAIVELENVKKTLNSDSYPEVKSFFEVGYRVRKNLLMGKRDIRTKILYTTNNDDAVRELCKVGEMGGIIVNQNVKTSTEFEIEVERLTT